MTWDEYNKLFHKLQLNLVAFKPLMECDAEVLKLVNAAMKAAYKDCAQIAETAEPYQAADLIRAKATMLFDDWDGGFPYRKEEK